MRTPTGSGSIVYLTESSVDLLSTLFRGDLEEQRCDACGGPLGIRPTIAFRSLEPPAIHVVPGSLVENRQDVLGALGDRLGSFAADVPTAILPTVARLCELAAARLRDNLTSLLGVLSARAATAGPTAGDGPHLSTPAFAAASVALGNSASGIEISVRRPDGTLVPDHEVREMAAAIQAGSWLGVARAWMGQAPHGPTFEEDLALHLANGVVVPGADERALAALDAIEVPESAPLGHRYCREAVRAGVCAISGKSNANVAVWVNAFLEIELESRAADADVAAGARPLLVSADRARATVPSDEFRKAMRPYLVDAVAEADPNFLDALADIAVKCGHRMLLNEMLTESGRLEGAEKLSVHDIIGALGVAAAAGSPPEVTSLASLVCRPLVEGGRFAELEQVAAALLGMLGDAPEARGRIDVWVATGLMDMGYAAKVIERIGSGSRPWESSLPLDVIASLGTVRAKALSRVGRSYEARDCMTDLLRRWPVEAGGPARRDAVRLEAELLGATGAPGLSVESLETLRRDASGAERLEILESLARTYRALGRQEEAIRCHEQALLLANGPLEGWVPSVKVAMAPDLALADRYEDAVLQLTGLGETVEASTAVLFAAAVAWIIILGNLDAAPVGTRESVAKARWSVGKVHEALLAVAEQSQRRGDWPGLLSARRLYTAIAHAAGLPDVEAHWHQVCRDRDRHGQPPSALELLGLAELAYEGGKPAMGRRYLAQMPLAMMASLPGAPWGGVRGVGHLAASSQDQAVLLNTLLDRITVVVARKGGRGRKATSVTDLRLIAEMRRDALGRAQDLLLGSEGPPAFSVLEQGLGDSVLAALAPSSGRIAVVEWLQYRHLIPGLITVVDAKGGVTAGVIASPEPDLPALASRIGQRLSGWRLGRPGDPFELPAWRRVQAWLVETLSTHLSAGDHVVFIAHSGLTGLPWHAAVADHWSASYATSWTKLLALRRSAPARGPVSIGLARVPQFNESQNVLGAMQTSTKRTRALAATRGLRYAEAVDGDCDREAALRIMAGSAVVKLLCHGFVSPAEHEVALMLAGDGALPLGTRVATDSEAARAHRFSWRDCRALPGAPAIVFSAACSSGVSHVLGIGEHVGLFAGLSAAGTRAMVAPRWDAVAAAVLPILDDVIERCVSGGVPVGEAVYGACRQAEAHTPPWIAWALAIEGDWTCRSHSTSS